MQEGHITEDVYSPCGQKKNKRTKINSETTNLFVRVCVFLCALTNYFHLPKSKPCWSILYNCHYILSSSSSYHWLVTLFVQLVYLCWFMPFSILILDGVSMFYPPINKIAKPIVQNVLGSWLNWAKNGAKVQPVLLTLRLCDVTKGTKASQGSKVFCLLPHLHRFLFNSLTGCKQRAKYRGSFLISKFLNPHFIFYFFLANWDLHGLKDMQKKNQTNK